MILTSLILILFVLTGALLLNNIFKARRRRIYLEQAGRLLTWNEVERRTQNFSRVVQTDFGYGKEVWAMSDNINEVDLGQRAFKTGFLIFPRPKDSDVHRYCKTYDIKLTQTLIK